MNFKAEKTDKTNEMKLEFTIDAKIFEDGIQEVFKKSAKYFNVPGFRKGKAPYNIVERAYGKEIFYEDAFNEVVPKIYNEEIDKNNIEAVSQPKIDIIQMEKGKDLIFTAIVQVKPEVKLGKYEGIEIYGLSKTNILRDIKNIGCIINSYKKCKKIMKEFKPDFVLGFGGYVTYPVILAAHKLGIKTGLHEQNQIPGKSNKMLSKYADVTFTSLEGSNKYFKNKVILSGNPCGEKALNIKPHDKTKLGFSNNKKLIIIVMGSLGSESVNEKMKDLEQDILRIIEG